MNKRLLFILATMAVLLLAAQPAGAGIIHKTVVLAVDSRLATVNGEVSYLDTPPFIASEHTMVPLRFVSTAFAADVNWNPGTRAAIIKLGQHVLEITPGKPFALVNGRRLELNAPAITKKETLFVPLRFVGTALGAQTTWNGSNRTVTLTSTVYQNEAAGFAFVCPGTMQFNEDNKKEARFTGPDARALVVEKMDAGEAETSFTECKDTLSQVEILSLSPTEIWFKRGNLIIASKLIREKECTYRVKYGVRSDIFNGEGRSEYELVTRTLKATSPA